MNADAPITDPSQDQFGYNPIAEQLAPILILPGGSPSLVAGVESPWGSGKTSFLNLTRRALERGHRDVLILEYRPWLYSTVDALLLGFCVQIAAQLQGRPGRKYEIASKAFVSLSKVFGRLRELPEGYGRVAEAAAAGTQVLAGAADAMQGLHEIDLSNAREKVQAAIDNAARPIVIVIDDVDRLRPEEIRLLFQFLKAVADFRGVAYLLAYDPKAVENALSFGGELSGREYLKKFIQLPIRLPRVSNLLLQRFFRNSVAEMGETINPALTASERSALDGCSQLAVFLQCLRTPRDAVRLLNSFRLRLPDCRDEVNLDELLLFVLLDLISPEAVDLVRHNPELFLLPMARHPEFEILEKDSAISRLMSESKDKAEARERLFTELPKDEQPLAKKLIKHLFEQDEYRKGGYDVRRAQTAHGLIKLLYGGTSSLSFSAKDAASFLKGKRRSEIIRPIQSSGVLMQWIYFLSSVTDSTEIKTAHGIATALIEAAKGEPANTWESVHRVIADYLVELFGAVPQQKGKLRLLRTVSAQRTNLFIAEHFLVSLASNAGLWTEGRSLSIAGRQATDKPDQVAPEHIVEAEGLWVKNIRAAAAKGTLLKHPHLGSILHRWGQFSDNDYSEVQSYFARFCGDYDPLTILRHFALGVSIDGLDKIVADPTATKEALSRYYSDSELRGTATRTMEQLEKLLAQQVVSSAQSA
jgi:predicted KAP-like P-loop ATPase